MTFENEIKEIRDFLDIVSGKNCYSTKLSDDEFETFTYLSKTETNLPYDIFVDTDQTYIEFQHPLCLYVVNSENTNPSSEIVPVTIEDNPQIVGDLCNGDEEITSFIKTNRIVLTDLANKNISGPQFFKTYSK